MDIRSCEWHPPAFAGPGPASPRAGLPAAAGAGGGPGPGGL